MTDATAQINAWDAKPSSTVRDGCGASSQKLIRRIEHPSEFKVKYIHWGDGGIGRRNGLKIRR